MPTVTLDNKRQPDNGCTEYDDYLENERYREQERRRPRRDRLGWTRDDYERGDYELDRRRGT